jgi:hypothetical protein
VNKRKITAARRIGDIERTHWFVFVYVENERNTSCALQIRIDTIRSTVSVCRVGNRVTLLQWEQL